MIGSTALNVQVNCRRYNMHFIKSNATEIKEYNPYKKVEKIGRICYKSEDKITHDSYKKFVSNLIERKHYAMLEHARLFFEVSTHKTDNEYALEVCRRIIDSLANIPSVYIFYVLYHDVVKLGISVSMSHLYNEKWRNSNYMEAGCLFDAFRCTLEDTYDFKTEHQVEFSKLRDLYNIDIDDIEYLPEELLESDPPQSYEDSIHKFVTVKFDCDRGVSHELVRHRCAIAQSSTRYCNYSKEKFGNGDIAFVYPHNYDSWDNDVKLLFERNLKECEDTYNYMIRENMSPQQARAILPNALATEVVLTMNLDQWHHFINLRSKGTTGAPHPDMKDVATIAHNDVLVRYFTN